MNQLSEELQIKLKAYFRNHADAGIRAATRFFHISKKTASRYAHDVLIEDGKYLDKKRFSEIKIHEIQRLLRELKKEIKNV